jgi:hypothetical protein
VKLEANMKQITKEINAKNRTESMGSSMREAESAIKRLIAGEVQDLNI